MTSIQSGSTPPTTLAADAADQAMTASITNCDVVLRGSDDEIGVQQLVAQAVYRGTPALVLVYAIDRTVHPAANGSTRIYTVDRATCAVLSSQTS